MRRIPIFRSLLARRSWWWFWVVGLLAGGVAAPLLAQPGNDNFDAAFIIEGVFGSIPGSNVDATTETNEVMHGGPGGASVWYRWIAPRTGQVRFDTIGSLFDTLLAVYTVPGGTNGAPPALTNVVQVASNNDSQVAGAEQASLIVFLANAGQEYFIAVDGFQAAQGDFLFQWKMPVNDNFEDAFVITGVGGTVQDSNEGATFQVGEPTHFRPGGASVWFRWVAPLSGQVTFDTHFSLFDTLLAVYTGTNLTGLTQIAGNDDSFFFGGGFFDYTSEVTILAEQGREYYIAVDGFFGSTGVYFLNWRSLINPLPGSPNAGYFSFSSTYYSVTEAESFNNFFFDDFTENPRDVPGALITVTRSGGAVGRVLVDYTVTNTLVQFITFTNIITTNGTTVMTNRVPVTNIVNSADPGFDYVPAAGTLVFDDYQTSTNFIVNVGTGGTIFSGNRTNRNVFVILALSNPRPAPEENPDLIRPQVAGSYAQLNIEQIYDYRNSFSIERAYYRVDEDGGSVEVSVVLPGFGGGGASVILETVDDDDFFGNTFGFGLQPGSDYAEFQNNTYPDSTNTDGAPPLMDRADYVRFSQRLGFGNNTFRRTISIPINDDTDPEFNEDFAVFLYDTEGNRSIFNGWSIITILNDDQPAGALDREWNADNVAFTTPPFNLKPGANNEVFALAVQDDQKTIIGGDFTAFNTVPRGRLARLNTDGSLDITFNPGTGPDGFVNAIAYYSANLFDAASAGKILIGGGFSSLNNATVPRRGIARLHPDGSVDTTFNSGSGFNGVVRGLKLTPDGRILAVGDFTSYNGIERRGIARLQADGQLDPTFAPGSGANGTVWSVDADSVSQSIQLSASQSGPGPTEYVTNLNTFAQTGLLTVQFSPECTPDRLTVYYGSTVIFDSGYTNEYGGDLTCNATNLLGPMTFLIPYGPGPFTDLTLAVNQGGTNTNNIWNLTAQIDNEVSGQRIYVGGEFTSINGIPPNRIARLNISGGVDPFFDPGDGADAAVFSVAVQPDLKVVMGGAFQTVDFRARRGVGRLNADGSLDTTFDPGEGANDPVYSVVLQDDGKPVLGGRFTAYDGVRRLGMARLFVDGMLDTTFLDTAYNQFAGLANPFSFQAPNFINAIALQTNGDFMIGGSFTNVGGNASFEIVDTNLWVFVSGFQQIAYSPVWTRQDQRTRFNVARVLGGRTPGPGNASLSLQEYYADEGGQQLAVTLERINGRLGTLSAVMQTSDRVAVQGSDYQGFITAPIWPEAWLVDTPRSVGRVGVRYAFLGLTDDSELEGDEPLDVSVFQPIGSINLGGETIPLGAARGRYRAPVTIVDNDFQNGVLTFSQPEYSVTEDGLEARVTLLRTNGSSGPVSVRYFTTPGTAASGVDYTDRQGSISFGSGETAQELAITIKDDSVVEPDETIMLVLTNASGGALLGGGLATSTESTTIKIIDNDFAPGRLNFARENFAVSEPGGVGQVTVTRTGGSVGRVTVRVITSGGMAQQGVDYLGVTNTLTWNSGDATPRHIYIPLIDEAPALVEGDEPFSVILTNASLPGLIGPLGTAQVTIVDDDAYGVLGFSQAQYDGDENGGTTAITVLRLDGLAGTVHVDFALTPDTATPSDYVPTMGTLEFLPGESAKSFLVTLLDDAEQDGDKRVILTLTNTVNGTLGLASNAVLNIVDNESFNGAAGSLDPAFAAQAGPNGDVLDMVLQSDGKVILAGDFTRLNGVTKSRLGRLNPDGTLDGLFNLGQGPNAPVRALAMQGDSKVLVGGFFTSLQGTNRSHIARLNRDGSIDSLFNPGAGPDNPVFAIVVTEQGRIVIGGSFATVNGVTRPGVAMLQPNGTLLQGFSTGTGVNGSVQALALQRDGKILIGGDFTMVDGVPRRGIARLNPEGSIDFTFEPNEGVEGVVRTLSVQPDGRVLLGGSFSAVGGMPRQNLARVMSDGSLDTGFLDGQAGADSVVLDLRVQLDGKIVVVGDFRRFNGVTRERITRLLPDGRTDPTINFGAGANAFISAVALQPDRKILIAGGFTQFNQLPRNRLARLHGGSLTGSGQVEFDFPVYEVAERQEEIQVSVRRIGGTAGSITATFTDLEDTATAGQDYVSTNGTLVFPEGEVLQRFAVRVLDDRLVEPTESALLVLGVDESSGASLGPQPVAELRVTSDDGTLGFLTASFSGNENASGGFITITVIRTGSTNGNASVDFLTVDGTAEEALDYSGLSGSLTFEPGEVAKTFVVPVVDDVLIEGAETVFLSLTNVSGSANLGLAQATLQIVDNDFAPGLVNFSQAAYVVNEFETNVVVTVLRTNGSSGVISVRYGTRDGTARAGEDYFSASSRLTFADGELAKTFSIPILPDFLQETNESVVLSLSEPSGGAALGAISTAILTIINNELIHGSLNFSQARFTAGEGSGQALVTVTRSFGNQGTVSVMYRTHSLSATAGGDYTTTTGRLDWAGGDSSPRSFFVPIANDLTVEEAEEFEVELFDPSGGATVGAIPRATVEITDDDVGPGVLGFALAEYLVSEDATNAQVIISRTQGRSGVVTVDFATVAGGSAMPGRDYSPTNRQVTFLDGQTQQTVQVRVFDNLLVEGSKTIRAILSNPGNGASTNGQRVETTISIVENDQQAGSIDAGFGAMGANGPINVLLLRTNNGRVLIAGDFTAFNDVPRSRVARLNPNGSLDTTFDSGSVFNRPILTMAVLDNEALLVGGAFTSPSSAGPRYLARLNSDGSLDTNFLSGLSGFDNQVNAVAVRPDGRFFVAGSFTSVHGSNRNHFVSLNTDGTVDATFEPAAGANAPVRAALVEISGNILIGGDFTLVNGVSRPRIARLFPTGALDPSFVPGVGANNTVQAIAQLPDGRILIGGRFTQYGGLTRGRVARLSADGTLDETFDPGLGADEFVNALAVQADGRALVGGAFTHFDGLFRGRLVRLNTEGSLDTTINLGAGANNFVSAIAVQPDRKIIVGGGFTEFDGVPRNFLARLNGGVNLGSGDLAFVSTNFNVVENGSRLTVTVRRQVGLSNEVTVGFATADGTAMAGMDYVATNGLLRFGPGEIFSSFTLQVLDNLETNADRTVRLTLSDPGAGAALGFPSTATVTIQNEDAVVGFAIESYSVSESAGFASIAVRRFGGSVGSLSLAYFSFAGTAESGLDYADVFGFVSFTNGQEVATFDVPIFDDLTPEANETVNLFLFDLDGSILFLGQSSATLTIVDDDYSPGLIGFADTFYAVSELGTNAVITLVRTGGSSGPASVRLDTIPASAVPGQDYQTFGDSIAFADGETNKTILIQIFDDRFGEGNELVNLVLSAPVGASLGQSTSALIIQDDELNFRFGMQQYFAFEGGPAAQIEVRRVGATNGTLSVLFSTGDDTAVAGQDYQFTSQLLTFADGELSQVVLVPILEDVLGEGDEQLVLNLFEPGATGNTEPQDTAVLTIVDNEDTLRLISDEFQAVEGATNVSLFVLRQGNPAGVATVNYSLSAGTATAGLDYTNVAGTLTFGTFETFKTITVPIVDDNLAESNETFHVTLSNPSAGATLVDPSTATVRILDNDISVQFLSETYRVDEDEGNALIQVRRLGSTAQQVSVVYVSSNRTALAGSDYQAVSNTLVFPVNVSVRSFSVPIIDDAAMEGEETLTLHLRDPNSSSGPVSLSLPDTATLTIADDDSSLVVPSGTALLSESFVPGNGLIDPNEQVTIAFGLRNEGNADTVSLQATLLSTNGVLPLTPVTTNYGVLLAGGPTVSRPFTFRGLGTNGDRISATFRLQDVVASGTNELGTVSFTFFLGQVLRTYSNTVAVTINDNTSATPYPSVITISNAPTRVARVTARLNNFSHNFPDDVDILLTGPGGQNVMLMSDAGGGNFNAVDNLSLLFDDTAVGPLPDSTKIAAGSYRPSNYGILSDPFPPPAPVGPFGSALSVFNDSNPNGAWSLFVTDDNLQDGGSIAGGWSLTLIAQDPVSASSDLALELGVSPDSGTVGTVLTYTLAVTNHGPASAGGVVVTNQLPADVEFVSANPPGSAAVTNGVVTFNAGTLASRAGAVFTVQARVMAMNALVDSAAVRSQQPDPFSANNWRSVGLGQVPLPTLSVARQGGFIVLSWPSSASTFTLQSTHGLQPANWTNVNVMPTDLGGTLSVTLPAQEGPKFYRLEGP